MQTTLHLLSKTFFTNPEHLGIDFRRHLSFWLSGLLIINIPALELTVGNFYAADYSLLFPSLYGLGLNAALFYGVVYSVGTRASKVDARMWTSILTLFGVVCLLESQLDALYYTLFNGYLTFVIYLDILLGTLIMNTFFFLLPGFCYGVFLAFKNVSTLPVQHRLSIKNGHEQFYLAPEEILYLESDRNYVTYHTTRGRIVNRVSLNQLEKELPATFVRCHRSFIINLTRTEKRSARTVTIQGRDIPVGRKYRAELETNCELSLR